MPVARLLAPLALALTLVMPGVAAAQSEPTPTERLQDLFRDMIDEMRPAIDDMIEIMRALEAIDDPRYYELPEVLPNGDIIIRRRPEAPKYIPPAGKGPGGGRIKT